MSPRVARLWLVARARRSVRTFADPLFYISGISALLAPENLRKPLLFVMWAAFLWAVVKRRRATADLLPALSEIPDERVLRLVAASGGSVSADELRRSLEGGSCSAGHYLGCVHQS